LDVSIWETNKISEISNSQLGSPWGFDSRGLYCIWIYKPEFEVLGWCRDNAQSRWMNQWYIRPRKLLFINILFYWTTTWCSQYTGSWYAWVTTGSYLCTQELWRGPTIYKVLFLIHHSYSNILFYLYLLLFLFIIYICWIAVSTTTGKRALSCSHLHPAGIKILLCGLKIRYMTMFLF